MQATTGNIKFATSNFTFIEKNFEILTRVACIGPKFLGKVYRAVLFQYSELICFVAQSETASRMLMRLCRAPVDTSQWLMGSHCLNKV